MASWAHHFLTALARHDPQVFVVIDLPTSLVLLFLQITVFIGLASRDMSDDDREWWARAGAWILIIGLSWLVAAAIAILGPLALDAGLDALGFSHGGGRVGLGLFTLLSGGAAYRMIAALASQARRWRFATGLALCLAAPVTTVLLIVLVSDGNRLLLQFIHDLHLFHERPHPVGASLPEDLLAFFGLLAIGTGLGRVISINQFSLHEMYRSRLVRTFLGVTRAKDDRHPSAFTGFDAADDMPFGRVQDLGRPLHVVNTTLNLVADNRLAVAERKATSFTMSPLHAGSRQLGYRPAADLCVGYLARRGIDDVWRRRQLEHGPGCLPRDDVPADGLQRAAGRLARQPRRAWRCDVDARGAGVRCRAARQRAARQDDRDQPVRAALRRRPLRKPRTV